MHVWLLVRTVARLGPCKQADTACTEQGKQLCEISSCWDFTAVHFCAYPTSPSAYPASSSNCRIAATACCCVSNTHKRLHQAHAVSALSSMFLFLFTALASTDGQHAVWAHTPSHWSDRCRTDGQRHCAGEAQPVIHTRRHTSAQQAHKSTWIPAICAIPACVHRQHGQVITLKTPTHMIHSLVMHRPHAYAQNMIRLHVCLDVPAASLGPHYIP